MSDDTARKRLIKLIHVAKRELGMDEDTYRHMLRGMPSLYGKDSAATLTLSQLQDVLDSMKKRGFKVRARPKSRTLANDDQSKLIRHLWLNLHSAGAVRDNSEQALASYVKRIARVDDLHWLSTQQASQVIETLKKWQQRVTAGEVK